MRAPTLVAACVALVALPLAPPPASAAGADGVAAKDPRNFTWVEEGVLAVGGGGLNESEVDWLHDAGFRAIADMRVEHQDPESYIASKGMAFLDMPIDSASHINETLLAQFIDWARAQKAAGRPIYIHCTNGWHRAAAFAVAFDMAEHGEGLDEAAREATSRRPGTVMRAVSGLLDLEAALTGKPQLAVVLVSHSSRPDLNATMTVHVDVVANGAPASGALVKVWSEESRIRLEGVTDATGRYTFTYQAPAQAFMDHLYARARVDGFVDGADNVEFLFGEPVKARGPLTIQASREGSDVLVRAAAANGNRVPVRVVASAPGWTAFESSDRGIVRFPDAPSDAIDVRVVSWGSEGGAAKLDALATPPPPPAPSSPPAQEPAPQPPAPDGPPVADPAPIADPAPVADPPVVDPAPVVGPAPLPGPDPDPGPEPRDLTWSDTVAAYARAAARRIGVDGLVYVSIALVTAVAGTTYVIASRKRSGAGSA